MANTNAGSEKAISAGITEVGGMSKNSSSVLLHPAIITITASDMMEIYFFISDNFFFSIAT
jgi:hypothetical protein